MDSENTVTSSLDSLESTTSAGSQVAGRNPSPVESFREDDEFFLNVEICYVVVDGTIFRVPLSLFIDNCNLFQDVFSLPPCGEREGSSHKNPLYLSGVTKFELKHLLAFLLRRRDDVDLPLDYLLSVLKLSMLWNYEKGKTYAIRHLSDRRDLDPALKMHLARKYDIDDWIGPTFHELIKKGVMNLKTKDLETMGLDTFLILAQTVKSIDDTRLYVAYCCPDAQEAAGCTNHDACTVDWQASWWSGYCKHLLHPEKMLSGQNALAKLETARFRQMGESCLELTIEHIRVSERLNYRQKLINEGIKALQKIHNNERLSRIVGPRPSSSDNEELQETEGGTYANTSDENSMNLDANGNLNGVGEL